MVSLNRGRILVLSTIAENFNDICILHLSDLHIVCKSESYGQQLSNLIDDVYEQTKEMDKILLVVSGDIIDKGKYEQANIDVAVKFFSDLYEKLNRRIVDIIMTPGNHDKHRDNIHELISWGVRYKNELVRDNEWKYYKERYKGFISLYNTLLYKFYKKKNKIKNTYGVHRVDINNQIVLFIRMDTAWSSFTHNDSYQLSFGENQRNKLLEEYRTIREEIKKNRDERDIITIGISHFPINLLKAEDEELCNKIFLAENDLDLDLLLCGHVHDNAISHYFNHDHSLLTLVTGIGNNDEDVSKPAQKQPEHRYSIYILNPQNNSCQIIMRKTSGKKYAYDYSIYTEKEDFKDNRLVYPIRVRDSHAFIELYSHNPKEHKNIFLDNNILDLIPQFSICLNKFIQSVSNSITSHKSIVFDGVRADWFNSNGEYISDKERELADSINDYLFLGKPLPQGIAENLVFNDIEVEFSSFLMDICSSLNQYIIALFSKDIIIRTHCRIYNHENDSYIPIQCESCRRDLVSIDKTPPRSISWTRIMQDAFHAKHIVQFSANPKLNDINTSWDDFLTIIPMCFGNDAEFEFKDNVEYRHEKRPCITFGISVKNATADDIRKLSVLSFLKLDDILKNIIDEFIRIFRINLKEIVQVLSTTISPIKEV